MKITVVVKFDRRHGCYRARFRGGDIDTWRKVPADQFAQAGVPDFAPSVRGEAVAWAWASAERERIEHGRSDEPTIKLRLHELLRWYIAKNPNDGKESTIAKYEDCQKRLNAHFKHDTLPERVDEDSAVDYRNAQQARGVRNRTIKGDLIFLKQVIVYGHQHNEKTGVDRVRLWKLPRITKQRALLQALTVDEVRLVLKAVTDACPRDGDRLRRILIYAITTGCRRDPLLRFQVAWCDRATRWQRIPGSAMKGGEHRWGEEDFEVPVCSWAAEVATPTDSSDLYMWPNPRTKKPNNQLDRSLWAIADKAGVRRFSLHELRKTFSSILADNGVHEQIIAVLMGHAASNVTREYIVKQPSALREAVSVFDRLRPYLEQSAVLAIAKSA